MHKYIFQDGGEAQDDSSFFNNYADSLLNQVDKTVPEDYQVDLSSYYEQDTENEYIRGLRESDPEQNPELDLENKYNDFSSKIDSYFEEKMNEYQNQLMIADFYGSQEGQENLSKQYDVKDESTPYNAQGFEGIFKNEGARTGQPTNLNSSALGRGQMVKGTRLAMYKKLGIQDISTAEQKFKTDPDFEMQVLNKYKNELDDRIPNNIQGKQRQYMIAKGWYTGDPFYPDNKVPGKEAGNKLTAGEYARRAVK